MEIGDAGAFRRLRQELQHDAAGAPAVAGAAFGRAQFLGDGEADARRDLLGAQEVFVRGVFQRAAVERHQALVAAHVRPLVDGHGEMAPAEHRAGAGLARSDRLGDARLVVARAGAHLAGNGEVHHQHAHRTIGLRLQDEAALDLQAPSRASRSARWPRRAAWPPAADRRAFPGSRRPPARAARRGRAGRARRLRTAARCRRRSPPTARARGFRCGIRTCRSYRSWALCSVQRPSFEGLSFRDASKSERARNPYTAALRVMDSGLVRLRPRGLRRTPRNDNLKSRLGVQAPGEHALLRVQAVFRLVEHHRLRPVDHLVGDLLAAVRRQAVHEHARPGSPCSSAGR